MSRTERRRFLLERVSAALAKLVRQEYPEHLTLAEIAQRWGDGVSKEDVEALTEWEL